MSKTTSEEAIAWARKHGLGLNGYGCHEKLASLIDEVRGVDAEPVGTVTITKGVGVFEKIQFQLIRGLPAGTHQIYTHPAPSQPVVEAECENCKQLVRALREAVESPSLMGEPVLPRRELDDVKAMIASTRPAPSQPAAPVELPVVVGAMYLDREEGWMPVKNGEVDDRFTPLIDSPGLPPLAAGWEWTRVAKVIYLSDSAKEPS